MAREKPYFREVVAKIIEDTGKKEFGVYDVMEYMNIGYNRAKEEYMCGSRRITVFQLASKLL